MRRRSALIPGSNLQADIAPTETESSGRLILTGAAHGKHVVNRCQPRHRHRKHAAPGAYVHAECKKSECLPAGAYGLSFAPCALRMYADA